MHDAPRSLVTFERIVVSAAAFLLALLLAASGASAGCSDPVAVAAARAQVDATCDCASAARHGAYVACARGVLATLVANGQLPRPCRSAVQRCAAQSTCGRPGAVTCCQTNARGMTRSSVKPGADKCHAQRGGSAFVGAAASACDACASGPAPSCGDGVVDPGEECDPPGTPTCDASCQRVPSCGDGLVDGSEACDGAPSDECSVSAICGEPGGAFACQCCSTGGSVFFNIYTPPYEPAPCCNGSECLIYDPHFCTCEPDACLPAGAFCGLAVECCAGLTCTGGPPGICQ